MDSRTESPNLDLLRSFAVLCVLLFHILIYFQHTVIRQFNLGAIGHWGVLIFFVHTSLVLMYSLERQQLRAPGEPLFGAFFRRRIFRVYPISMLVVLVIALFRLPVGHLHEGKFIFVHVGWQGLLANLFLIQDLTHTESIIAVLWTLPYELHMYVLLPFVFLVAKWSKSPVQIFLLVGCAIFVARHSPFFERHGFPDFLIYVPCFLGGVVAYKISSTRHLSLPGWLWPITVAVLSIIFLGNPSKSRSWWCCLALGILTAQFREITNPIVRKISLYIARYSYGIYLTHFILIWFVFDRLGYLSYTLKIPLLIICVTLIPIILYHTVEEPMIRVGQKLLRQRGQKANLVIESAV